MGFVSAGIGMFKVRRSVVVDVTGFRLFDVTGSSIGATVVASFFADLVPSLAKFVAESKQKHRVVTAEDRKFKLIEQVPQPFGRQAQAIVEKG